jgi:tetratricopeptide (TPR) repeat protein
MKTKISAFLILIISFQWILISCGQNKKAKSNQEHKKLVPNSESRNIKPNKQKAQQLFDEGMDFVSWSRSIYNKDRNKALELNTKSIEKFTEAYKLDTLFSDAALMASETTVFAKDYLSSLFWLNKLLVLDTSKVSTADKILSIGYCYVNIGELQRSKSYFQKAMELWKEIGRPATEAIRENLLDFSNAIFEQTNAKQQSILKGKGLFPCDYSVAILSYLQLIDTVAHYDELISTRKDKCR